MVDVDWQLQRLVQGRPPCTVSKRFDFSRMGEPVVENTSIADYVWLPLRFEDNRVVIEWKDEWRLEDYR